MPRRTVSFLPCRTQVFAGCLPEMAQAIKRWNYKACSVFKRLSHNPPFSRRGEHFCSPEGRRSQNEHKKSRFPRSHLDRGHQDSSGKAGAGESLLPSTILCAKGTSCPAHSLLEHQAPGQGQSNCKTSRPCPLYTCRFSLNVNPTPAPVYMFLNQGNPGSKAAWKALC